MSEDLAGKIALVTGAACGIGRACALKLAAQGADLILNDLGDSVDSASLIAQIESMGRKALWQSADVADPNAVETMFAMALARIGPVDLLVNNAAWSTRKPFLELTTEEARRTFDVSFWGGFDCTQHAARQMAGRGGSIVMISSVHAFRPYPNAAAYNAAKAALNHLVSSLALELAPQNIRVNAVEPGWIDTPGERSHNTDAHIEATKSSLPLGRLGTAAEVASAVAYLCSSGASYITGSTLRVDGGFSLRF